MTDLFQPICSPTECVGEFYDGSSGEYRDVSTVGVSFEEIGGIWTKVGDFYPAITFYSNDKKDVTITINFGGDNFDKVRGVAE